MVHDRRIDGKTHVFGNAGSLYMTAMTWFDHTTDSIWSQPWGRAIQGEYSGVELFLLPSQLTTWASWRAEHPETLVMINDVTQFGGSAAFSEKFVIGLILGDNSKAYYYADVANELIVNDTLGPIPVFLWAADNNFHAYVRQVGDQILTFEQQGETIIDSETGSSWDLARGLATDGSLAGEVLQPVPSTSAFDWAWQDFYPESEFYTP